MPWCEDCGKYMTPNTLRDDGSCPTCGRVVEEPVVPDDETTPWHFKLLVVALVVYLGYRFVQIFL